MKRIITFILSIVMIAFSSFITFAKDESDSRKRLGLLIQHVEGLSQSFGYSDAYFCKNLGQLLQNARQVYSDDNTSDAECDVAYEQFVEQGYYTVKIKTYYVEDTLLKAESITNEKKIYSDENWNKYQEAVSLLRMAVEDNDGREWEAIVFDDLIGQETIHKYHYYNEDQSKKITEAFHILIFTYNKMVIDNAVVGDVNRDRAIDVLDATCIQKYSVQKEYLTYQQKSFSDVNNDGTTDVHDATLVLKYSVNKIDKLAPYCSFIERMDSYESEIFLTERLLNYDICPMSVDGYYLGDIYYCSEKLQSFYLRCEREGIDYK